MFKLVSFRTDDVGHVQDWVTRRTGRIDPWRAEYRQLQGGRFAGRFVGASRPWKDVKADKGAVVRSSQWPVEGTGALFMSRNHFESKLNIVGTAPKEYVAFFLPIGSEDTFTNKSTHIGPDQILALGPGEELSLVTGAKCRFLSIRLQRQEAKQLLWRATGDADFRGVLVPGRHELGALKTVFLALLSGHGPVRGAFNESRLLEFLATALDSSVQRRGGFQSPRNEAIAWRALDYLEAHRQQAIRIDALCAAVGAQPRTVFHAFKSTFGLAPMDYHRKLRLRRVRDELKRAHPAPGFVTRSALRWGFEHLGRFAVDYKAMFGETPAQTLGTRQKTTIAA